MIFVNDNGVLRQITRAFANDNGVLREFGAFYANDNGVLRTIGVRLVELNASYAAEDVEAFPTDALCQFRLNAAGTIQHHENGTLTTINNWLLFGAAADYQCRMTLNSGTNPTSGTMGTWLSCSANQIWELLFTGSGSVTADMTFEIRLASSGTVLDSSNVIIYAESAP
jgi:hypothetical protein